MKRLLSAATILAMLASPVSIWAQAGECMAVCSRMCHKDMAGMRSAAEKSVDLSGAVDGAKADSGAKHCSGMNHATHENPGAAAERTASSAQNRQRKKHLCGVTEHVAARDGHHVHGAGAACCNASHKNAAMETGVNSALLIGLTPETFELARLFAVRQAILPQQSNGPLFLSSPPFEPPRS
jgi:hypothetical protein